MPPPLPRFVLNSGDALVMDSAKRPPSIIRGFRVFKFTLQYSYIISNLRATNPVLKVFCWQALLNPVCVAAIPELVEVAHHGFMVNVEYIVTDGNGHGLVGLHVFLRVNYY